MKDRLEQFNQVFALFGSLVGRVSWEANPKGKGLQKEWMFFKKEVLKGAEAGHPHVLDEERKGLTRGLNRALHGTAAKKESMTFGRTIRQLRKTKMI